MRVGKKGRWCADRQRKQNLNRIKKIQEWLPKAMDKRSQSDCTSTTAFADLFRRALETGQFMVVW